MSNQELLEATALWERAACLLVLSGAVLLWALARRGRAGRPALPAGPLAERWEAGLTPAREAACLFLILLGALLARTLGWDRPLNLPYWFAQTTPLYVAELLREGTFWSWWRHLFTVYQQTEPHLSALMLPVAALFQVVLGPSIHLPVLVGAFWGGAAVLLGWALGRSVTSKLFGLCFAAFIAVSPLQLVWSRTGGITIGASAYLLLVLWCSFLAGRRRSAALAVLAGVLAWGSLYQYYATRVSIPLALLALLIGSSASPAGRRKAPLLLGLLIGTFVAIYGMAGAGVKQTLWPEYAGYVGNQGEQGVLELVTRNVDSVLEQLGKTLRLYFLSFRFSVLDLAIWEWGMASGGLSFTPVAALGFVGLLSALWSWKRNLLWLALVATGLAVPLLSVATPRRLLLFDLGWCALASLGLLRLIDWRPLRAAPPLVPKLLTAALFVGLGGWAFASVALLHRAASVVEPVTSIPFANASWINDGRSCWRCVEAGHAWQQEIAGNRFVVLFDTDPLRENRTTPGGLPLYGKLAALAAGREGNFVEFYPLVRNFDLEPPIVGQVYDARATDFASHLIERIEAARPDEIVWHFEVPTQWERWLAERLAVAGGVESSFATPLGPAPGFTIRTPWSRRGEAFAILRELASDAGGPREGGIALREIGSSKVPGRPLELAPVPGGAASAAPEWIVRDWREIHFGELSVPLPFPGPDVIGFAAEVGGDGRKQVQYLLRGGALVHYDSQRGASEQRSLPLPGSAGPYCAQWIGGRWWVVDPISGSLLSDAPGWRPDLPQGRWIGIGRGPHDELLLASADQQIHAFDVERGRALRHFPASIWPSLRVSFGECAPLVAGADWVATLDHLRSRLTFYDLDGVWLGSLSLDVLLGLTTHRISSIGAQGSRLGVGIDYDDLVKTFEVVRAGRAPRASRR